MESPVLTINELVDFLKMSRATIWRREREGLFPKKIKLTPGRAVYRRQDVMDWLNNQ